MSLRKIKKILILKIQRTKKKSLLLKDRVNYDYKSLLIRNMLLHNIKKISPYDYYLKNNENK